MRRKPKPPRRTFACPHCGAEVKQGAKVCRECGSDADTGWQSEEEIDYQSLDLPQGWSEDPEHPAATPSPKRGLWFTVVAVVLAALLLTLGAWRFFI